MTYGEVPGNKSALYMGGLYTEGTLLYCGYVIWCVSCTVIVLNCIVVVLTDFVMCGCCIYCFWCCLYCVFCIVSFMNIYSYLFCLY